MSQLKTVTLHEIRENPIALRAVNRQSEKYLGLVDSIREKGFFGAITVRERTESGLVYYELVDGLHRFAAAKDAGLDKINVDVVSFDDDQTLEVQLMANIHRVETTPMEYTQQLKRILIRNPLMTETDLATKLGKSKGWIIERLGLLKIDDPEIAALVDEGKINLSNAYALAKLPADIMKEYVEKAQTLSPSEFIPMINTRVKEIKEANRKGKDVPTEFSPVAYLQKLGAIKTELENNAVAATLVAKNKITDPVKAAKMMIAWVLHLDPDSIQIQKAKDAERKKEAVERADQKAKEKAAKDAVKVKVEKPIKL